MNLGFNKRRAVISRRAFVFAGVAAFLFWTGCDSRPKLPARTVPTITFPTIAYGQPVAALKLESPIPVGKEVDLVVPVTGVTRASERDALWTIELFDTDKHKSLLASGMLVISDDDSRMVKFIVPIHPVHKKGSITVKVRRGKIGSEETVTIAEYDAEYD